MKFVLVVVLFLVAFYGVVNAKTTDELIEETEKLLGSAPHVVATPPLAKAAKVQKPPMAKAMPVQQAKPVGGLAVPEYGALRRRRGQLGCTATGTTRCRTLGHPRHSDAKLSYAECQVCKCQACKCHKCHLDARHASARAKPTGAHAKASGARAKPTDGCCTAAAAVFTVPARPFAGPQSHSPWNPPAAGAAQQSSVPIGGVPPPPALLLETNSKLRGKRIGIALNAAAFGYGRAVQGTRHLSEPLHLASAAQGTTLLQSRFKPPRDIVKPMRSRKRKHGSALTGRKSCLSFPRPVASTPISPAFPTRQIRAFYRQHDGQLGASRPSELHNSIAELNNIPDASEGLGKNTGVRGTEESPRFAENIVKSLPDFAKAASGDSTKAALKQPIDRAVSVPAVR